jgi:glucokinase
MAAKDELLFLAGDIGGTKTLLGLFFKGRSRPRLKKLETYQSREARNPEEMITAFLAGQPRAPQAACLGIAGPVLRGEGRVTNRSWKVSEGGLKKRFHWDRVRIVNDLTATAMGVLQLKSSELLPLNRVRPSPGGNRVLLAPGTGLGVALLIFQEGRYLPVPSEGGHVDFSPRTEKEVALWRYLHQRFNHVSLERILSGPGLVNIYSFLKDSGRFKEPSWLSELFRKGDPARVIAETGLKGGSRHCAQALDLFISILGAAAGNLALTGMATGGVYLGGGIPPKILPALKQDLFLEAFTSKGRFRELLKEISVRVILNERTALLGAAQGARQMLPG